LTSDQSVATPSDRSEQAGRGSNGTAPPREKQRRPLVELLAEAGVASMEELRSALSEGLGRGERLGEVVLRRGWIDEPGLARLVARQWEKDYFDDAALELDERAASLLPPDLARRLGAYAIGFRGDVPVIAVAEPSEAQFAEVTAALDREAVFAVGTRSALDELLDRAGSLSPPVPSAETPVPVPADDGDPESLLAELDRITAGLVALRERVEPLARLQAATARELAASRERLASFEDERDSSRETVARLEAELAQQRERFSTVKAKLVEVNRTLDVA